MTLTRKEAPSARAAKQCALEAPEHYELDFDVPRTLRQARRRALIRYVVRELLNVVCSALLVLALLRVALEVLA